MSKKTIAIAQRKASPHVRFVANIEVTLTACGVGIIQTKGSWQVECEFPPRVRGHGAPTRAFQSFSLSVELTISIAGCYLQHSKYLP